MKNFHWLLGTIGFAIACSGGDTTNTGRDLPPGDDFGVRFSGGETADFGNGTDDVCGTSSTDTAISVERAEQLGLDVAGDRAWLAEPHIAILRYNPSECADEPYLCDETLVTLSAEVVEPLLVEGRSQRPSEDCEAEWQAFAYRVAVSVSSQDGYLSGTFYARAGRRTSDSDVITITGRALSDLRNFEGELPIELDAERAHYAYLDVRFALASDGSSSGRLEPAASYYDERRPSAVRVGPDAVFDTDELDLTVFNDVAVLTREGSGSTLSTYPGSSIEPLVDLRVRADAVEPMADVDLKILINGQEVRAESVAAGTSVELGKHPFGTTVSVEVHNANGAGSVRANVLQDNCFAATSQCGDDDCTTQVEYTAALQLCVD